MNHNKEPFLIACLAIIVAGCAAQAPQKRNPTEPVTVIVPSATTSEVSRVLAARLKYSRAQVVEATSMQVVILMTVDLDPRRSATGACDSLPRCQIGTKNIFLLQQNGNDVAISPKYQSVQFPGTTKEQSLEAKYDDSPEILSLLGSIKTYYVARSGEKPQTLAQLIRVLPKGLTKAEIMAVLGKPSLDSTGKDGKTILKYEDKPKNVPSGAIGTVKGDECLLTLVNDSLSDSMCLSGIFSK